MVLRLTFDQAVAIFPDSFFDVVYIDGYAHTGQDDGKTLRDWWPKLKVGGLFSGHDYHPKFPKTVKHVDDFCKKAGAALSLTDDEYPSWYFRKGGVIPQQGWP